MTHQPKKYTVSLPNNKDIILTFLPWAEQADVSIIAKAGETTVLTTVVMSRRENDPGYFPLTVEYRENYYAAGKIGGGRFRKREGRPSDDSILKARLIDRALRPLFDHHMRREIQIVNSVLSYDPDNCPETIALVASATALAASDIPFNAPLAAVRVAKKGTETILNPSETEQNESSVVVTMAGARDTINMLEIGANEAQEDEIQELIAFGFQSINAIIDTQEQICKDIGQKKASVALKKAPRDVQEQVRALAFEKLKKTLFTKDRKDYDQAIEDTTQVVQDALTEQYGESSPENIELGCAFIDDLTDEIIHHAALNEGRRVDGRAFDEIRPLSGEINLLPRTHGSGIFMRGLTHILSTVTLGIPGNEELHDDMTGEFEKRFMHHYNFPPYSVGETGPFRGPGRREIGHGALAEKALKSLIPPSESFPYVIRAVSEVLSSNGSSSMGSVCASSLALFHAGVPLKSHIAGIAMGLIMGENNEYKVLTDIQGPEDHHGDMDLKVAGTRTGITAAQMDIKVSGISLDILMNAFEQAKKARLRILDVLELIIPQPSKDLSKYVPLLEIIRVNPDLIGLVIGSGGSTIKEIQTETQTEINIQEDGTISIGGTDKSYVEKAIQWIQNLTHEVKAGDQYNAKVIKTTDFGAFIALTKEQEALVHISELADGFVKNVTDEVKVGQRIPVRILSVDPNGKISASAKNIAKEQTIHDFLTT
ncbi:MAG: polyribonucleotide nucleotidyltransferase [Candidatus Spechtbacteria bacterium SB0662_bin_43]|uniref:Polyribonucleotide nucleotidyltransferase n=1 Tax=Candidatus Spechtbacteria bacterium SB0662_bin_43 TaxID=2604897 RepID=A0A845D9F9_9BACT|nr:polyribonucleotide nucleotidyltransferase [Candidatus Spechtbacteria bacterium SB0662_bin_43]